MNVRDSTTWPLWLVGMVLMALLSLRAQGAAMVTLVKQVPMLPAMTHVNKAYRLSYQLKVHPQATRRIKKIAVIPVSSNGIFDHIETTCGTIDPKQPTCWWHATWKPTMSGSHWVNLNFFYGGVLFKGNRRTRQRTRSSHFRLFKASSLPARIVVDKTYRVDYLFRFDAGSAVTMGAIAVTPIASGGVFKKVASNCDHLRAGTTSCSWHGRFTASRVGHYRINLNYGYTVAGKAYRFTGGADTGQSTLARRIRVRVTRQAPLLPASTIANQSYPVHYKFEFASADAAEIGGIDVTPVLGGDKGGSFSVRSSSCSVIAAGTTSCSWHGRFTASRVGHYRINLNYGYTVAGKAYRFTGGADTGQSTSVQSRGVGILDVVLDPDFSKPSVARIKVTNASPSASITDVYVDDSMLGRYFQRFNGRNGGTPVGPWCTSGRCPQRCGALASTSSVFCSHGAITKFRLDAGKSCYIYVRATLATALGSAQTRSLTVSSTMAHASKTIALTNTKMLYVAGTFTDDDSNSYVARYDGSSWSSMGSGPASKPFRYGIRTLARDAYGGLYVGGDFDDGSGHHYLARYDGRTWSAIDGMKTESNKIISHLAIDRFGRVYMSGWYEPASPTQGAISRYDPDTGQVTKMMVLGDTRFNGDVLAFALDATGSNLYVGSRFRIDPAKRSDKSYVAKYNGNSWSLVGTATGANAFNNGVYTMVLDANDNLYVAGIFDDGTNTYVARLHGSTWRNVGSGPVASPFGRYSIQAMVVDSHDNLYAGGGFNDGTHPYIARYDADSGLWSNIGSGPSGNMFNDAIFTMLMDTNDNLYVGGKFYAPGFVSYVARYNGKDWVSISSGGASAHDFRGQIEVLAFGSLLTVHIR